MSATIDRQVHHNIVQAWKEHKDRTGVSQTRAAQSLGIGQSAFHQYLKGKANGGIPLNRNFVVKFAKMVGSSPTDLGWEDSEVNVKEVFIPVRFTNTGTELSGEKISIDSAVVPSASEFAVKVTTCSGSDMTQPGDVYLCRDVAILKDGMNLFVVHNHEGTISTLIGRYSDSGNNGQVTVAYGGGVHTVSLDKTAKAYEVIALYFRR